MFAAHKRVSSEAVLNGIAMDRDAGRVFVTGKLWDRVYEVGFA
jgi:glutamine cyclotransferase